MSSFLRSTSVVGGYTLLSRVTGLVRDMVYSRMFGAGVLMDAFLVAFKIPNFMRRLFAEGAFSQAFVPVVSEYKVRNTHDEARDLVDGAAGTLASFLALVTVIGIVVAPLLVLLFAPGFRAEEAKFDLTVEMLRWTFPYLLFISLTALAGGVLNSYGRFAVPAFTSTLLNLTMIVFAAWVAPRFERPGIGLAIGVFVAGALQLAFQIPFMLRLKLLRRPRWRWDHAGVRRIGRLMLPAIFGSSVSQVALLLDTLIASFLATGSIAWLYYADRLMEFPLGVFSIALATVILPSLAAHHAAESPARFTAMLDWALRLTIMVVLPATAALLVMAGPLTVAIFHYGRFDENDVRMASLALMAYSSGLLGFSLVKVLAPGFFARQDTRTPVRIGIQSLGVNIGLNLAVVLPAGARVRPPGSACAARAQQRHRGLVQLGHALPGSPPAGCAQARAGLAAPAGPDPERDSADVRVPVVARWRHRAVDRDGCLAAGAVDEPAGGRWRCDLFRYALAAWSATRGSADAELRRCGRDERWNWSAVFITCGHVITVA